jgi:hypothetical protein
MQPGMTGGTWSRWSSNAQARCLAPGACSAYDVGRKRFWWITNVSSLPPLIRYLDVTSREQREVAFQQAPSPRLQRSLTA